MESWLEDREYDITNGRKSTFCAPLSQLSPTCLLEVPPTILAVAPPFYLNNYVYGN